MNSQHPVELYRVVLVKEGEILEDCLYIPINIVLPFSK